MTIISDRSNSELRRERRMQRQRKEILDAAASLFAEKGYAATSTKDIAQAADIGESTLYGYFPGKRDVMIAILSQPANRADELLFHSPILNDRQAFIDLADTLMDGLLSNILYTRALVAEAWVNDKILDDFVTSRAKRISNYLEAFIVEKTASGLFRAIDPILGARILLSTFTGAMLPVLRGLEPVPTPEQRKALAGMIVSILLDGLIVRADA
jgi:AcrR family transcriptional regulator